ncbi:MAG TPA: LysR family transcriptional regulator [Xanthobacteraceae bacterium]|jgi:DNA-binding transcriptional LysR family regulator|nr:LysR family transcriptional regulator [Xanthobacteraceae bacterium]
MPKISPDDRVGRRLRFRDLQVFFAVVQLGSMAKAGARLGLTQPGVSDIVAGLEQMFGVPLFDRNSRGVVPTIYGRALLKRGQAAFDELRQGIRDIDFLSDPTAGELKIGCPASIMGGTLSLALERFSRQYPRVVLRFDEVTSPGKDFPSLRERDHDFILSRIARPLIGEEDFDIEVLFQDPLLIAADANGKWARRRKIDPAELVDESWILTAADSSVYQSVAEAFRAKGLAVPQSGVVALSGLLRMFLVSRGPFITVIPRSLLVFNAAKLSLKILPVDLEIPGYPVAILTLKNRVLNPLVGLFIEHVRDVARSIASPHGA